MTETTAKTVVASDARSSSMYFSKNRKCVNGMNAQNGLNCLNIGAWNNYKICDMGMSINETCAIDVVIRTSLIYWKNRMKYLNGSKASLKA